MLNIKARYIIINLNFNVVPFALSKDHDNIPVN
jgi:hypothetical protein